MDHPNVVSKRTKREMWDKKIYVVAMYMCNSMQHLKIYHMPSSSHTNEDQK